MKNQIIYNNSGEILLSGNKIGRYSRCHTVRTGSDYFVANIWDESKREWRRVQAWSLSQLKKLVKTSL